MNQVKTKWTHPYNYDPILYYQHPKFDSMNQHRAVYSDRLYSWNQKKYDELCRQYFGETSHDWTMRNHVKIEKFLQDYLEKPNLILTKVEEHCNKATGYPVWVFLYVLEE